MPSSAPARRCQSVMTPSARLFVPWNMSLHFLDHKEGLTQRVVWHIYIYMSPTRTPDPKLRALADSGTANPHPEAVRDPAFVGSDFFDPRDLVQVKYEMLRRVRVEHACIAEVAALFGLSRPTFYKVQADFARTGLTGLLPGKRGPRGAHKLTPEVLAALAERINQHFGYSVHRRTVERALAREKKKR